MMTSIDLDLNAKPKILIVDDQASVRLLIRQVLTADGYQFEDAENGHRALGLFPEFKPDLVLLDCLMPGMDGIELCRQLKDISGTQSVPVLMITSLEDDSTVERAFDAGVSDYVTKPINFAVLRQRVRYLLKAGIADRQMRYLAFHDGLTGLANRVLLMDRLRHGIARAARQKKMLGLVFVDLDHFKWVNDTLGHATGDEVLKNMAARLKQAVRDSDTVVRLGGDEFVLLIENMRGSQDVATVAQKVLDSIQAPLRIGGREVQLGGSLGIAVYPSDGYDADQLMTNADTAMYRVKEGGRNRYEFYTAEMGAAVQKRVAMVNHMRNALAHEGALSLHFQPQIELSSGRVQMLEALVRWQHPEIGLLNAAEFLPLAEESGQVRALDEQVLRLVCRQLSLWRSNGVVVPPVSVNFSAHHFRESDAVAKLARILEETGALGENLMLEISEHVTHANDASIELALNALKELGIGLCVDDFGTGLTSLRNLQRYPIDSLKINAAFTHGLGVANDDSTTLMRGILLLAKALRVSAIAEAVETPGQALVLRELGCEYALGYFFSKPVSAAEVPETLARFNGV
ncbi:MAG: EAL domain-containing protein [Gammaproteobacteria bacterium]|nr:EAL domain-containing protein [Gammaproteobacteria bacterium]